MTGKPTWSRVDVPPGVWSIEDAAFWIAVLHRRTVSDAHELELLRERVRRLERPWWKRWKR